MEEIEFSRWLFEGRPKQGKNKLPDGLNWLCCFAGSTKRHRENSIYCIFLESPHQVDMKNVVKCCKHFFAYFNALKTVCDALPMMKVLRQSIFWLLSDFSSVSFVSLLLFLFHFFRFFHFFCFFCLFFVSILFLSFIFCSFHLFLFLSFLSFL